MRCSLEIHTVTDGRPDGVVEIEAAGIREAFTGWVELLRILEQQCGEHLSPPVAG
jgi:hypothetical protein